MRGFEFPQRADPLATRQLVDFCGDDGRLADGAEQPLPRRHVALETRMARIDEEQRASPGRNGWIGRKGWMGRRRFPFLPVPPVLPIPPLLPIPPENCARQFLELVGRAGSTAREPVSGEIHQVKGSRACPRDVIDVREPRLAGRRAGTGNPLPDERVDQSRFADVRAADDREFGERVVRHAGRVGHTPNERGFDFQWNCRLQTSDSNHAHRLTLRALIQVTATLEGNQCPDVGSLKSNLKF